MNDYYFFIREDGSMQWKGSGHGPCVYHTEKKARAYHDTWRGNGTRILHMWISQGTAQTEWLT